MIEAVYTTMRIGRNLLQRTLEPLDLSVRLLNNKHNYPSLHMRQLVGGLNDFEGSSGEYVAYLKLLCNLMPGDKLLDIGCGCGTILYDTTGVGSLPDYLGEYWGVDVDGKVISWCNNHLGRDNVHFHTTIQPTSVDVVLAKSLFTHLNVYETEAYLHTIQKILRRGGHCLATFFLLNGQKPQGKFTFKHVHGCVSYQRESKPQLAVAYDQKWLLSLLKKSGFSADVYYGAWREGRSGLSFQDIIVLRKE